MQLTSMRIISVMQHPYCPMYHLQQEQSVYSGEVLKLSLRGWEAITFLCIESIDLCLVEISVLTDLSGVNIQ